MIFGHGPEGARFMIVGECFNRLDEIRGKAFSGSPGEELARMLHEAGIMASECYFTNVVNACPERGLLSSWMPELKREVKPGYVQFHGKWIDPIILAGRDQLLKEIALVKPQNIIALGNLALLALTGEWGITKWRGSMLTVNGVKCIPTLPPGMITTQWELRPIAVMDLKRAAKASLKAAYDTPDLNLYIQPDYLFVFDTLTKLLTLAGQSPTPFWIDFDIETAPSIGHITCAGITWSNTEGLCIPFTCNGFMKAYWSLEEEASIVFLLMKLLTHPNVKVRGQNLLYDCQYTHRWWHFIPNVGQDTMISHHTCFPGLPKSLAFQASMYCEYYRFWKDMHKTTTTKAGE